MSKRIEWPGGWAELEPRITHARRMRIVRKMSRAGDHPTLEQMLDFNVEVAAAYVATWSVGDVDAVNGPPTTAFDALSQTVVDLLTAGALEMQIARADPNASTATSGPG